MKVSTKGRYGLRLMLDLALHFGEGPVLLKDIAARQGISEKYLWHLSAVLKNAGLITSARGARGGYALARPPAQINLREIVSLLEGPLCLVECVENSSYCRRSGSCAARDVWHEVSLKILGTLGTITLEKIAEEQRKKSKVPAYAI